jgi:hypothetical protein
MTTYMTYGQCVEYLHTTVFDDEIRMDINVIDVGKLDSEGFSLEFKWAVVIALSDGQGYEKRILLRMVRENKPFYFRSLDKIFKDILWMRDSSLHMVGHLDISFYEEEIFYKSKDS